MYVYVCGCVCVWGVCECECEGGGGGLMNECIDVGRKLGRDSLSNTLHKYIFIFFVKRFLLNKTYQTSNGLSERVDFEKYFSYLHKYNVLPGFPERWSLY